MRDIEKHPYSPEEQRVADYIAELTNNQIGAGDDPIGFLIASHGMRGAQIKELMARIQELEAQNKTRIDSHPDGSWA